MADKPSNKNSGDSAGPGNSAAAQRNDGGRGVHHGHIPSSPGKDKTDIQGKSTTANPRNTPEKGKEVSSSRAGALSPEERLEFAKLRDETYERFRQYLTSNHVIKIKTYPEQRFRMECLEFIFAAICYIVDVALEQAEKHGKVNVLKCFKNMLARRNFMNPEPPFNRSLELVPWPKSDAKSDYKTSHKTVAWGHLSVLISEVKLLESEVVAYAPDFHEKQYKIIHALYDTVRSLVMGPPDDDEEEARSYKTRICYWLKQTIWAVFGEQDLSVVRYGHTLKENYLMQLQVISELARMNGGDDFGPEISWPGIASDSVGNWEDDMEERLLKQRIVGIKFYKISAIPSANPEAVAEGRVISDTKRKEELEKLPARRAQNVRDREEAKEKAQREKAAKKAEKARRKAQGSI